MALEPVAATESPVLAAPVKVANESEEITLFWNKVSLCVPAKDQSEALNGDKQTDCVATDVKGVEQLNDAVPKGINTDSEGKSAWGNPLDLPTPPHKFNGKIMKPVVWNLTGMARPNELMGLLGPSGCGKTLLLNIISDRLYAPQGSVYKRNVFVNNNVPLTRDLFGKIGAYVMQDDVLLETLTPYESVRFSANLRLSCSQEEKDKAALRVIELLKLQTCMNTVVSSHFSLCPIFRPAA